jgi:hypothetical protein
MTLTMLLLVKVGWEERLQDTSKVRVSRGPASTALSHVSKAFVVLNKEQSSARIKMSCLVLPVHREVDLGPALLIDTHPLRALVCFPRMRGFDRAAFRSTVALKHSYY